MTTVDQGFTAYGAHLFTQASPYDPVALSGGRDDSAVYMARPGIDFLRPWLAIEKDIAFQWPLGIQGFTHTTDPVLGKHSFIGDNKVTIDVINSGNESLTLSGTLPGDSSPALYQALREVVRRVAPNGKILFVPELMSHANRVQVSHAEWGHDQQERSRSLTYTIDFDLMGEAGAAINPPFTMSPVTTTAANKGNPARLVSVDAKHNTLRLIAQWKLGSNTHWDTIYQLNEVWFVNHAIPKSQAPTYRLPIGLKVYW